MEVIHSHGQPIATDTDLSSMTLPREVVDSPSLEILKQRLDRYLLEGLKEDFLLQARGWTRWPCRSLPTLWFYDFCWRDGLASKCDHWVLWSICNVNTNYQPRQQNPPHDVNVSRPHTKNNSFKISLVQSLHSIWPSLTQLVHLPAFLFFCSFFFFCP